MSRGDVHDDGRVATGGSWVAPRGVRQVAKQLEYWFPQKVSTRPGGVQKTVELYRKRVRGRSEILDEFIALYAGTEAAIVRFARHNGVLVLCSDHVMPVTHAASCRVAFGRQRPPWREPVAAWRTYSRLFAHAVVLGDQLQMPDDGDGHGQLWAELMARPREDHQWHDDPGPIEPVVFDSYHDNFGRVVPIAGRDRERIRAAQRRMLSEVVDEWLRVGGVRTFFSWDPTPLLRSSESSLFGSLALTLALRIARRSSLFTCDNCGGPIPPRKYRPPRIGERHFCRKAACQRASRNQASRDYRRRKK